ncbi:MAG: RluA family pseudouridine synthase [Chloroflexota bacterium]
MTDTALAFQYNHDESQRLDLFLVEHLPEYSRSFLQGLIQSGMVSVDGTPRRKTGTRLNAPQLIEITIPESVPSELVPEAIELDIIHEDRNLIVVNKPPGMVVHPSAGHQQGTLIHAILAHAPNIEGVGGVQRPGLVHRLDKDTSGVIVLAKNDRTHQHLQAQFKDRLVEKTYIALVDRHPPTPTGRIEAAIGRDPRNRQRMAIVPETKGKMAISEYKVLESFPHHSLLEVSILTGRTHQIRLHLTFLDCPVVGDLSYGLKRRTLPVDRQQLHAQKLGITLPGENKLTSFEAPLPDDIRQTLKELRKK